MDNINIIDEIPFEIHLKKGEIKTFSHININNYRISSSNKNIEIFLSHSTGDKSKYKYEKSENEIIDSKKYSTIEFKNISEDTIINLY